MVACSWRTKPPGSRSMRSFAVWVLGAPWTCKLAAPHAQAVMLKIHGC